MGTRLELQQKLEDILGSRNVYFQPPSNIKLNYPAIVYELKKIEPVRANNSLYLLRTAYDLTLIEKTAETQFTKPLLELPYCSYDRPFISDGLYHNVFTIYW